MKKYLKIYLSLVIFFFYSLQISAQTEADTKEITRVVNGVTIYFYEQKLDLFAELWDEKATFITVMGLKANGKKDIVDMHSMGKYIIDSSTETIVNTPIINYVRENFAIAYSIWGGLVFKLPNGAKSPKDAGYLTVVLHKTSEGWKILSATNANNVIRGTPFKFSEYSHDKTWTEYGLGDKK